MSQAGSTGANGGGGASDIKFLAGNTGGNVGPSGAGVVNVIGSGTITVVGNPGTNTLTISDSSEAAWVLVSTSTAMTVNTGYFCVSPGGDLTMTLPATSLLGQIIEVFLDGATSFTIAQNAGQNIVYTNLVTTTGVAGSVASTAQGCSVKMVCSVANTRWNVVSSMGNFLIT